MNNKFKEVKEAFKGHPKGAFKTKMEVLNNSLRIVFMVIGMWCVADFILMDIINLDTIYANLTK